MKDHKQPASGYRGYLLFLLTVILAFNYVDRLVLGIVLQDVKVELSLTDTQLGLLTGIAFALFYSMVLGALSDALQPRFGNESLRYALAIMCPGCLWPAWHLWRASRTVTRDLKVGT